MILFKNLRRGNIKITLTLLRTNKMRLVFFIQQGNNNNLKIIQRDLKIIIFKTFH